MTSPKKRQGRADESANIPETGAGDERDAPSAPPKGPPFEELEGATVFGSLLLGFGRGQNRPARLLKRIELPSTASGNEDRRLRERALIKAATKRPKDSA